MGKARDAIDRMTAALTSNDLQTVAECYCDNAVATTPDQGEVSGRAEIVEYLGRIVEAFPDAQYEYLAKHESGDVAIDEGYLTGTNTGDLTGPGGASIPATGRQVRIRECDVVAVDDEGLIREHRFYYDQMAFLEQLGLLPETAPE
jgi:ketosteroid isomerase-like protein